MGIASRSAASRGFAGLVESRRWHYLDATGTPEGLDAPALSNLRTRLEAKYPEEFRGTLDGRTAPPVPVVR